MKKQILLIMSLIFVLKFSFSQSYFSEILSFQQEMNADFSDSIKSPLLKEDLKTFKRLEFFPIDSVFRIEAAFIRTPFENPFPMKTTTSRAPMYVKYGEAIFTFENIKCKLNIYQSLDLMKKEGFQDYLFLPFTDASNGDESYGGGRYIELKIPEKDKIRIDFNKAYNPYCAYNHKYSCPIPPAENNLPLEIKAGVKKYH
ncbi:MAG: DUF1684 domain-containing protein [Bacteroidales bacterium]